MWEVAHVRHARREPRDLNRLALGEKPIGDPTLIEDLDRARVQTTGSRTCDA